MKNILFVNFSMNVGGIETFLMNVARNIDNTKFNIIFLCFNNGHFYHDQEIIDLGFKIIKIDRKHVKNSLYIISAIKKIIKDENINIVHDCTYFYSVHSLIAAKQMGVKVRISHSHTSSALEEKKILKKIKHSITRLFLNKYATDLIACSEPAGKALFGKYRYSIIPNGIDVEHFSYQKKNEIEIRKEFDIADSTFVIGHVGRFQTMKNHLFLLDVFNEYLKINADSKLLLVGEGEEYSKIINKIKEFELEDKVIISKFRDDYNKIYSAFNIFVMPSIYEGFPMVLLENQSCLVPALISDNITKEVDLVGNINFISLNETAKSWAEQIDITSKKKNTNVLNGTKYDIKNTVKELIQIYSEVSK